VYVPSSFLKADHFLLNGERLLLRGTHRHEDSRGLLPAALPDEVVRREMRMIRDMGSELHPARALPTVETCAGVVRRAGPCFVWGGAAVVPWQAFGSDRWQGPWARIKAAHHDRSTLQSPFDHLLGAWQ